VLEYQKQNCELTLREGMSIYHSSFPYSKEIYKDGSDKKIWRYHDATHVIFGMDVSLEEEAILDTWTIWGTDFTLIQALSYYKLPELKELQDKLFKELKVSGFLMLYKNVFKTKIKVLRKVWKMKKKWPYQFPNEYYDKKISDLRKEYGISILKPEEKEFQKLMWSGALTGRLNAE
jgi:hypothetical protein